MSPSSNLNVTLFNVWIQSGSRFSGWISLLLLLGVALQVLPPAPIILYASMLAAVCSVLLAAFPSYGNRLESIHHHGIWFSAWSARGWSAWLLGLFLTVFYVLLYWWPEYLGWHPQGNLGLVALFDPLSAFLKGQPASQWFVYGCLYTFVILLFGFKFIIKYRGNRYQVFRTVSIMFFQTAFAFLIPEWLMRLNLPYNDFKNMWPLNYSFFDSWNLDPLMSGGSIGWLMLVFGILMIVLISPVLTYLYGKRWYCSWVCGCGGLAETAGDSFRHLADRSIKAWKIERIVVYSILLLAMLMTAGVLYTRFSGQSQIMGWSTEGLRKWYGFYIGGIFSGVIGVGFYPLLGSRVWCRFGCPMAAILGIQQRLFSRFRITVNGGQCISCGNCSAYCEMGIDVRAYAQRGQDIVRASCVGCGICSAVCPRGVLKLENGNIDVFERGNEKNPLR